MCTVASVQSLWCGPTVCTVASVQSLWCGPTVCTDNVLSNNFIVFLQLTANGRKIRLFDVDAEEDDDD